MHRIEIQSPVVRTVCSICGDYVSQRYLCSLEGPPVSILSFALSR
jgi:hypothetical protein